MSILDDFFYPGTYELNKDAVSKYIPQLELLKECKQNPKWHSEGTAYDHTILCLKYAYRKLEKMQSGIEWKRMAIMAVLLHDIGKSTTTFEKNGVYHSYGHEFESERITRLILWDEDFKTRETICSVVRYHMDVLKIFEHKDFCEEILRLAANTENELGLLYFVKECDVFGSIPQDKAVTDIDAMNINEIRNISFELAKIPNFNNEKIREKIFNKNSLLDCRNRIIMLIGLPGSGKDTFIKNFEGPYEEISRDKIRVELGYCKEGEKIVGSPEQEDNVTKKFNEQLLLALKNNKIPIINNINLKKKYRDALKNFVKENGYRNVKWDYIYIEAPTLSDNIKRREGQINSEVFRQMILGFDWPRNEEYHTFQTYKQIVSKNSEKH